MQAKFETKREYKLHNNRHDFNLVTLPSGSKVSILSVM